MAKFTLRNATVTVNGQPLEGITSIELDTTDAPWVTEFSGVPVTRIPQHTQVLRLRQETLPPQQGVNTDSMGNRITYYGPYVNYYGQEKPVDGGVYDESLSKNYPVEDTRNWITSEENEDEIAQEVTQSLLRGPSEDRYWDDTLYDPVTHRKIECPNPRCRMGWHGTEVHSYDLTCPGSWHFESYGKESDEA